jgi:hypothetical protein
MLPLAGDRPPTSADEFARALHEGLGKHGVAATVVAEGKWPNLQALRIDLANSNGSRPLPRLQAEEGLTIAVVTIGGHPVQIEGVPAELDVHFSDLRAGLASGAGDGWQVVPLGAKAGQVMLQMERDRLETALHDVISQQAGKHGASVKSTRLELSAPTPRSVAFAVICTAKMFIASTTLTIRGLAEIDENLNAKLSGLTVEGEGMMGTMAQGFIQPHLEQWNGRVIPLASYVAGGLALRDVHITVGEKVRVEASLGTTA